FVAHHPATLEAPSFPNIDIDNYYLADQNEPTIAINPTNPNNIIVGANDYRNPSEDMFCWVSFDGGKTWKTKDLPSNWTFASYPTDPAIAFNISGKAFYSYGRAKNDAATSGNFPINDI